MKVYKIFDDKFREDNIKTFYIDKIQYTSVAGRDKVNRNTFNKHIDENIELINRKVMNGTYKFSSYKMILSSKGKDKPPRVLSMPTIRDKIVLGIMKEVLLKAFEDNIDTEFIKNKIDRLSNEIQNTEYDCYIKIDMQKFYDTIDHDILIRQLKSKTRKKQFLELIRGAITTPTLNENQKTSEAIPNELGVPQGLSISNILASIYLNKFDEKHSQMANYSYYRYVDDILILCKEDESCQIVSNITEELTEDLKLKPHKLCDNGKTCCDLISNGFSYLGYYFNTNKVSVRRESVLKLEKSIEQLFGKYSNNREISKEAFIWLLNLRITGAVYGNKSYGWMYFFSQINDENLLYRLDSFVLMLSKRYGVSSSDYKRFVRTFWEIRYKRSYSKYIPNFDNYSLPMMKEHLIKIAGLKVVDVNGLSDEETDRLFRRSINKNIKDIEKDIQNRS